MCIKKQILIILCSLYSKIKPIEKKVLFESFGGLQYSDNPRAISEKLHEMYPEYRIVWAKKRYDNTYGVIPSYVSFVKVHTLKYFFEVWTSIALVTNTNIGMSQIKRSGQIFIQTWHGDRYFKNILYEADANPVNRKNYCDEFVTDLALAGSEYGMKMYRNAFHYQGEVYNYGCPRNEKMLSITDKEKNSILRKLGVKETEKVFLYAPTFRDNCMEQEILINLQRVSYALKYRFGGEWKCIIRGHIGKKLLQRKSDFGYIDVTNYPDMVDLLAITDFLITDYSSTICDYYLTQKPSILAIFDINIYEKKSRSFKLNPRDTPFLCAVNNEDLEYKIRNYDLKEMKNRYREIDLLFKTNETGKATKKVCEYIDGFYNERCQKD